MSLGILYESKEWSNIWLNDLIMRKGVASQLIHMENYDAGAGFNCDMYVNRVFPSSKMRGHFSAIDNTIGLLSRLREMNIPVLNALDAFRYECSKSKYYKLLSPRGLVIPEWLELTPDTIGSAPVENLRYPLVMKRDCGGRSFGTRIVDSKTDLLNHLDFTEESSWIVQEFVSPVKGYTTRVEILGREIMIILKRFVAKDGISSYSHGSTYELYPECPGEIIDDSYRIFEMMQVDMGGIDFIETENGIHYLIDVNPSSNFTADQIPLLGFDPIEKMADYVVGEFQKRKSVPDVLN